MEAYFRQQYFEVLDILKNELERRFDQESLKLLVEIERLLIDACNGNAGQPSGTLQELYESEIDFKRLEAQLAMLPDLVETVNLQNASQVVITQVTAISTVCDMMNNSSFCKAMFSEVHKLLRIYLTVPRTCICRTHIFHAKKTKNLSCATMSQNRLNHIIILHTHISYTDDVVNHSLVHIKTTQLRNGNAHLTFYVPIVSRCDWYSIQSFINCIIIVFFTRYCK